jgi:hypothetical protein
VKTPEIPPEARLRSECRQCHAKAGEWCKNYKGQRKPLCKRRGEPEPPAAKKPAPTLFDEVPE